MSKVQAAEMRVLRLIKDVTRRDRLQNEDVRKELGVYSILDYIEQPQLRWYGREENNRWKNSTTMAKMDSTDHTTTWTSSEMRDG